MVTWKELMDQVGPQLEPIPPGDYNAIIHACEYKESSTKKPMWKLTFKIKDGPQANRNIFSQQTLTADNPNAVVMFMRQMSAMGLTKEYFMQNPPHDHVASTLVGRSATITVGIQKTGAYAGRNEVSAIKPPVAAVGAFAPPPGAGPAGPPVAAAPAFEPPPAQFSGVPEGAPAPQELAPPAPVAPPVAPVAFEPPAPAPLPPAAPPVDIQPPAPQAAPIAAPEAIQPPPAQVYAAPEQIAAPPIAPPVAPPIEPVAQPVAQPASVPTAAAEAVPPPPPRAVF